MYNILIVEDHQVVAQGLTALLVEQNHIDAVHHAADGNSCLEFLSNNKIDIILLDINLPDCNGLELCKEIRQRFKDIKIIGLSTFNLPGIINKMLENGAEGYLMKNASSQELLDAIDTVMQGRKYLSAEATQILKQHQHIISSKSPVLTKREKELLKHVAEGLTNQEIADLLFISVETAISHRKSLLQKTNSKNTAQLLRFCYENGLF